MFDQYGIRFSEARAADCLGTEDSFRVLYASQSGTVLPYGMARLYIASPGERFPDEICFVNTRLWLLVLDRHLFPDDVVSVKTNLSFDMNVYRYKRLFMYLEKVILRCFDSDPDVFGIYLTFLYAVKSIRSFHKGVSFSPEKGDLINERVLALVREHASSAWSLEDIAAHVGVSREHLCREFAKATGITLGAYIRAYRLFTATYELLHTDNTTAEIAYNNGYSCVSAFYRAFGEFHRCPPAAFRKGQFDCHSLSDMLK